MTSTRHGRVLVLAGLLAALSPGVVRTARAASAGVEQHGSTHESVSSQSYLGVDVRDVGSEQVGALRLKNSKGAEIVRVDHDGPAGKMGLHEHDVVLEMNGKSISGEDQMRKLLRATPPGTMVVLLISRDGQALKLSAAMADREQLVREAWEQHLAHPGAMPADTELIDEQPASPRTSSKGFLSTLLASPTYTGAMLEALSPQLAQFFGTSGKTGGLLVRSVVANSPAEMAGLHAGDVVTRVNFKGMTSVSAWTKMIKEAKGKPVTLNVMRDHQERSLTLIPDVKRR